VKRIPVVLSLCLVFLVGCNDKAKNVSMKANATTTAYVIKMKKGETTREQDQAFIDAVSQVTYELDRSLRGQEKADNTKNTANLLVSGIDPTAPLRLIDDAKEGLRK